jgi:general secretion pathway protein L
MSLWLGIDIGTSSVKAALVRAQRQRTTLEAISVAELGDWGSVEECVRIAADSCCGGNLKSVEGIAVGLEGTRTAVHILTVPGDVEKQLGDVLTFELEAQLPFALMGNAVFDYRVLKVVPPSETDEGSVTAITAIARIDEVMQQIELVKSSLGVEPERVGAGPFTLASLVAHTPELADDGPIGVIDIGGHSSDFIVFEKGNVMFARTLTSGIAKESGGPHRIARDVKNSIAAYRSRGGSPLRLVYISGGGSYVSGVHVTLADDLDLPVELLPTPSLDFTNASPFEDYELTRYTKALSLAVGLYGRTAGMNLRRGELRFSRGFDWIRERVPQLAGLTALFLVSFFFAGGSQLFLLNREKAALEGALEKVSAEVLGEATRDPDKARQTLAAQQGGSDENPMPHADAFDVMVRLSEVVPSSMTHDVEELDVQKGHVTIHGIVDSIPDAQSIAQSLRSEPCFSDVRISRTSAVVGGDRQKYMMEFDLRCPEDQKQKKTAKKADAPAEEK